MQAPASTSASAPASAPASASAVGAGRGEGDGGGDVGDDDDASLLAELKQLLESGGISQAEYDEAVANLAA